MDSNNVQYFNHQHILIPLTRDEHEEIICKACDKPILQEIFHGCMPCTYYLHDECLNAPRSVQHPSHHSHPLTLLPRSTYPSGSFVCDACGSDGDGMISYSCAHCSFDLHLHCSFSKPSILLPDLHPHELKLTYDPHNNVDETYPMYVCDACGGEVAMGNWAYCCGGDCDFGIHLDCVKANEPPKIEKNVEGNDGGQPLEVGVDGGEPEVKGDDGEPEEEEVDDGGLSSSRDAMNQMLKQQQEFQMMMNRMEMKRMQLQLMTRRYW